MAGQRTLKGMAVRVAEPRDDVGQLLVVGAGRDACLYLGDTAAIERQAHAIAPTVWQECFRRV